MRRTTCILGFLLLVASPPAASAIQLHWSSGADTLSFATATRCVLLLRADSAEAALPAEWRLMWLADSSGVRFLSEDSTDACVADTARVSLYDAPLTRADSAGRQLTAHFCSADGPPARTAYFVLDQPGGSRGRLKIVALDPADPDSNRIIESNEVTYNGGVVGDYAPIILRAGRAHPSVELRIEAVGIGLADAGRVEIVSPDTSWRLALNVEQRTDRKLTAVARVAADLPPFVLNVGRHSGELGVATLPADTASLLFGQPACVDQMKEMNLISHEVIQPKDFTIIASRDSFHVFYTRQDYNLYGTPELDSKIIGHKRSHDLYNWFPTEHTMNSVTARPGMWDGGHVWAPSIVKKPGDITYYMHYTGVDASGVQRIGVATSTDLNVWSQDSTASYMSDDVNWALQGTHEFRDAFVMPDTDSVHYLMYFVTKSQTRGRYVVGVARTAEEDPGNLRSWTDPVALWNTDSLTSGAAYIESPHVFRDPGDRWWLLYTGYNAGVGRDSGFVSCQTNDVGPADTDTTRWSSPDSLYRLLDDETLKFWHASEYYGWAPGYEYLMAFNDNQHSIDVAQISWRGPHSFVLTDSCPPSSLLDAEPDVEGTKVALSVRGSRPGKAPVAFSVLLTLRMQVELVIFDIAGRRLRTLLDDELVAGEHEVRWDGRGPGGEVTGAGVYFARLSAAGDKRITKIVLLR